MTVAEMLERGVYQVRLYGPDAISVQLRDGRQGSGKTFAAALAKAEGPDANDLRKAA